MKIAIINESKLKHERIEAAVKGINLQLKEDFCPAWSIKASCRYYTKKGFEKARAGLQGVIYIRDKPDARDEGTLGYHDSDIKTGFSLGYVFVEVAKAMGENWTVTLSHEVLEMALNPDVNYFAISNTGISRRTLIYWLEACDPVQSMTYKKGRIEVSNFVLPHYFTPFSELDCYNDFLETPELKSFSAVAGGYVGYYDPDAREEKTWFASREAEERFKIKSAMGTARRKNRVSELFDKTQIEKAG
jgi:hypothetical protein